MYTRTPLYDHPHLCHQIHKTVVFNIKKMKIFVLNVPCANKIKKQKIHDARI